MFMPLFYGSVLADQGEGVGTSESETESWDRPRVRNIGWVCTHRALCYKRACLDSPRSYKEAVWSLGLVFLALELRELSTSVLRFLQVSFGRPKESWKCLFISV